LIYRSAPVGDPQQAALEELRAKLKLLDRRIARMRKANAGTTDPLADRLLKHAMAERAALRAKLPPGL